MKKLIAVIIFSLNTMLLLSQTPLKGVTFGFAPGFSMTNQTPYSYFLSPDSSKTLQQQRLSKTGFVISSVISVKLSKVSVDTQNRLIKTVKKGSETDTLRWYNRFSIVAALNMLELSNSEIAFNKNIDGGLGIGYLIGQSVQLALFYDLTTRRQIRQYILDEYLGKSIPNGNSFYNALDENDNNLFYNKSFSGFSLKVIFSLGNKD